jgi:hypothetical protein
MTFKPICRFSVFTLLLFCSNSLFSQALTGRTFDSSSNKSIQSATIMLLKAKDSTLYAFTRSDNNGNFQFKQIRADSYNLLITYPEYADYYDKLQIGNENITLGTIDIIPLSRLIEAVIIKAQKGKMRLRGDTLIYLADSFKTKENATVEDLLKKLPGLQVNRNGEITAQGKKVERVLVDGEEFFGEDPTMATRNLDAKMVQEVKVYDAQSEEAKRTGDQNAEKVKTLDIKLKDDAKRGYFGNVAAAASADLELNEQRALYANFKGKRKVSLFGIRGNTNNTSLSWDERNQFGSGTQTELQNGMMTFTQSDDNLGYYDEGLPKFMNLGGVYSNQWKKHKVNISVSNRSLGIQNRNTSNNVQLLREKELRNYSESNDTSQRSNYRVRALWEYAIDSQTTLTLTGSGTLGFSLENNRAESNTISNNTETLNSQKRLEFDTGQNQQVNGNIKFNHQFKKAKRQISAGINYDETKNNSSYFLNSGSWLKNSASSFDSVQALQLRASNKRNQTIGGTLNYVEPLHKNMELLLGASVSQIQQTNVLDVFNPKSSVQRVDSLANDYEMGQKTMNASAGIQWHKKKWNISVGLTPQISGLSQNENVNGLQLEKRFNALLPNANVALNLSKTTRISMMYYANVQLPSLYQLQPVINNANPLYINVGNTKLRQSLANNYSFSMNAGSLIRQSWFMIRGNFTDYAENFITSTQIDSVGRTVSTTEMGKNNYNYSVWSYYHKQVKGTPIMFSLSGAYSGDYSQVIQNGLLGNNTNSSLNINPSIYFSLGDIFSLDFDYNYNRNNNRSSLREDFTNINFTQSLSAGFDFGPINKSTFKNGDEKETDHGWSLEFNYEANFRQRTRIYNVRDNHLIHADISFNHKKYKDLIFSLSVNDLLNQNFNYNRYVNANQIYETTNTAFRRYFLFNIKYKFNNKMKTNEKVND